MLGSLRFKIIIGLFAFYPHQWPFLKKQMQVGSQWVSVQSFGPQAFVNAGQIPTSLSSNYSYYAGRNGSSSNGNAHVHSNYISAINTNSIQRVGGFGNSHDMRAAISDFPSQFVVYSTPWSGSALPCVSRNENSKLHNLAMQSPGRANLYAATAMPYASNFTFHQETPVRYAVKTQPSASTSTPQRQKNSPFNTTPNAGSELPFSGSAMPYGATLSAQVGSASHAPHDDLPAAGSAEPPGFRQSNVVAPTQIANAASRPSITTLVVEASTLRRPPHNGQGAPHDATLRPTGGGAATRPSAGPPPPALRVPASGLPAQGTVAAGPPWRAYPVRRQLRPRSGERPARCAILPPRGATLSGVGRRARLPHGSPELLR